MMSCIRKKFFKRKQPFLLLEVLIALFLLSICSGAILAPNIMLYRAQNSLIEKIFVDMKAAEIFTYVKEELYRGEDNVQKMISQMPKKYKNNRKPGTGTTFMPFSTSVEVSLLHGQTALYDVSCELFTLYKGDDEKYYYLTARLYFDRVRGLGKQPYQYEYSFVITQEKEESGEV